MKQVHMTVNYTCKDCGKTAEFYCQRGVEENFNFSLISPSGALNKPIPFCIECPNCNGNLILGSPQSYKMFSHFLIVQDDEVNLMSNSVEQVEAIPIWSKKSSSL